MLVLNGGNCRLLLGRSPRLQKLLQRPFSVQAEAEIRMLPGNFQSFIDNPALNCRDFGLVVRVSDIEMDMRHHIQGPFFRRINQFFLAPRMSIDVPSQLRTGLCRELRQCELQPLFAEILLPNDGLTIVPAADGQIHACAPPERSGRT